MLSIELSRKLKDAGIVWEPAFGDLFYWQDYDHWEKDVLAEQDTKEATSGIAECTADWIFAPRLDQLLAKIEAQGWFVVLSYAFGAEGNVTHRVDVYKYKPSYKTARLENKESEEAAAQALLWIYERGTTDEMR